MRLIVDRRLMWPGAAGTSYGMRGQPACSQPFWVAGGPDLAQPGVGKRGCGMTSVPDINLNGVDISEAARQLALAVHDAQVAYGCAGLGNLARAHAHATPARIAPH